MLPDKMSISGSKKNLYMSMKNDTGLDFTSNKKIILNAAEGVYFKTPKKVIINGENSILVTKARQKKGFSLEGDFNILGSNSKIEVKDRTTYPDFNDEPKNDTKAKAAAIAKKKAEAEKKSGFSWGKLALFAVAAVAVVAVAVVAPVAAAVVGAALIGAALGANALASSGKLEGLEQKLKNEVKDIKGLLCGALMGPYKFLSGTFSGLINSAKQDIMGLINFIPNIVKHPKGFLKDIMFIDRMLHPATANDYMMQEAVLGGLWKEIETDFNNEFLHGDADSKGKYTGAAIWTVITLFNPEGKVGDLGKVDKVINAVDETDDGEKLIKDGEKVAKGLGEAGLTAKDIPTAQSGKFNAFFNSLTSDELDELWKDNSIRKKIERELRAPGGLHEWHLVSRAPQFKRWGISAEQIKDLRSAISDVKFKNPIGMHGGLGSTTAHNELLSIIDSSQNYNTFIRRLNNWANYRLEGGINSLPQGLRLK